MKKIFMFLFSLIVIFGLNGCNKSSNLDEALANLNSKMTFEVTDVFTIPELDEQFSDVSVSFTSDNTNILNNDGAINQPILDTDVNVTITLSNDLETLNHDVTITVIGMTAEARIAEAKTLLVVTNLDSNLDFSDIELEYGVEISFTSNDLSVINNSGEIFKNGLTQNVDLSFTIEDGETQDFFSLEASVNPLSDQEQVDYVISLLEDFDNVSTDLVLIEEVENYLPSISWESENTSVISNNGVLSKPIESVDVTLVATITLNDILTTKSLTAFVAGYDDTERVELAKTELSLDFLTAINNFSLQSSTDYNVSISWESDSTNILIVGNQAIVTRPSISETDAQVTLTAEMTCGNATATKEFTITVTKHSYTSYVYTSPTKEKYTIGESIDLTGGLLSFILDDSSTYDVLIINDMINITTLDSTGETVITINYLDITETFLVYVYSEVTDKPIAVNESLSEDFDDIYNPNLSFDNAQTPNSTIVDEQNGALSGNSLYFESSGNYNCIFINGGVQYEANETYRITFDYKIKTFNDTIYFQLNGGASGNQFTQFGSPLQIDNWEKFSYVFTLGDTSDYLIQIFPGGGTGLTSMIIDNIKFEHISNEPAKNVDGEIPVGDYVLDTFGDLINAPFIQDLAPTPNSMVIAEAEGGIEGMSLYLELPGSYTGIYLNEAFQYTSLASYRITFDYKILELQDTIYFQLNGGSAGNLYTQFGLPSEVGTINTFTWDVTLADTSDYIIQIFPGGSSETTKLVIDNLKIERLTKEQSVTTSNELAVGESVVMTFGDPLNEPFTLDLAPTPNSSIVENSVIDGNALNFVSPGSYTGIYLNENFVYTANATYRFTFTYNLSSFADTIYFQLTGVENQFTQFGALEQIGSNQTFTWEVTLGNSSDYIIQIFSGGSSETTDLLIDNLTVERIA